MGNTKNGSAKPKSGERLIAPAGGVAVRAYRQGLGDCFLLAFGTRDRARTRYVLIDCGVHARQEEGTQRLAEVMDNLVACTGGKIDVVVATHEHADHLSGFVQKGSPFVDGRIKVGQFWVAWTEKLGDEQADRLRARRGAARAAIEQAIRKLEQKSGQGLDRQLRGLMDFELMPAGPGAADVAASGPARPSSNEVALGLLKQHATDSFFCEPGQVLTVPGVADARAYVLGPPRDERLLARDLPAGGRAGKPERETYLAGRAEQGAFLFAPGLGAVAGPDARDPAEDLRHPFESALRFGLEAGGELPALKRTRDRRMAEEIYCFLQKHYFDAAGDWRRIDHDWLAAADELALDLDNDTNNTSLVLAFELGAAGEGDVLLFTGDAQVGNWLSWRRQEYRAGGTTVSADDLLRRTTLYKVGHHGSHNATVRLDPFETSAGHPSGVPFGLELMPSRMIAFIPVDRAAAEKRMPSPWEMPYPPLYAHLLEKASGRVLRSDGLPPETGVTYTGIQAPETREWTRPPGLPNVLWREADVKFNNGRPCPLFYDIQMKPR